MMQTTLKPSRAARWATAFACSCALAVPVRAAAAQATPPKPTSPDFMLLVGTVMDSVHIVPLPRAIVSIEGTNRSTVTNADGEYRIDSIPPGKHRVVMTHPLLDTLGAIVRSQEFDFKAGEAHSLDLSTPSGEGLAAVACSPAFRNRGPAVMIGFVRDPDTNGPAKGSEVSLVYYETDVVGRKQLRAPKAPVDSLGRYKICGLPADMSGKVQVFRGGVSSGEVPTEVKNGIAVRAFSIVAKHVATAEVTGDSGKVKRVAKGNARVSGTVVDKTGKPLSGARVALQGGGTVAITGSGGDFSLDSLPSGTQALEVRKLGYAATEQAVELSANAPARTKVMLSDFVPTLAVMRTEAKQDKALSDVGYLGRKNTGLGYFLDGNQINHASLAFSDVMRMGGGLKVTPSGDGRTNVIQDSRNAANGCVNFYVDGFQFQETRPGEIDNYVRPDEMVAVEIYHGSGTPPQFQPPGQSGCATVVVWTVARIRPDNGSKKP